MALLVFCFILFHCVAGNENYRNDGILHHLNSGIKFAKEFLGSESIALKVADFVVRAFQPPPAKTQQPDHSDKSSISNEDSVENTPSYNLYEVPPHMSPLRHLVRLFGLQPNQISAVAVNALIFVAQMITTFLSGPQTPNRPYRSDDMTTWILKKDSRRLQELITFAKNESLPELVEDLIKDQESEEETFCIRLLICKITPFVYKMQMAVFKKEDTSDEKFHGSSFMYKHLPSNEEINSRSKICEQKFKECKLHE